MRAGYIYAGYVTYYNKHSPATSIDGGVFLSATWGRRENLVPRIDADFKDGCGESIARIIKNRLNCEIVDNVLCFIGSLKNPSLLEYRDYKSLHAPIARWVVCTITQFFLCYNFAN